LLELGYARTTVNEICRRAGLSHGALFRFFPTLTDLVLAGAEEIARMRITEFESHFAETTGTNTDPHRLALGLLRDACRSPTNMVFYELLVAARTDDTLRPKLRLGMQRYRAAIRESSLKVPALAALDSNVRDMLVFTFINYFDGESLLHSVLPEPDEENARFELLMFAINFALAAGADKIATTNVPGAPAATAPEPAQ
jgi:AcrR family transcriptional regulator